MSHRRTFDDASLVPAPKGAGMSAIRCHQPHNRTTREKPAARSSELFVITLAARSSEPFFVMPGPSGSTLARARVHCLLAGLVGSPQPLSGAARDLAASGASAASFATLRRILAAQLGQVK